MCIRDSRFRELYAELPKQIIHRDPNPSNIITNADKWGFIDFDLSECSVRIYDPCYAASAILSAVSYTHLDVYKRQGLEIMLNYLQSKKLC